MTKKAYLPFLVGFAIPYLIVTWHHAYPSSPWSYWMAVRIYWFELALWPGGWLFWGSGVGNLWPYWLTILAGLNGALYYGVAKLLRFAFTRRHQ